MILCILQLVTMRNLAFIVLSIFVFSTFYSCKKPPLPVVQDDISSTDSTGNGSGGNNGEEDKVNPFVGTWKYTQIDLTNGTLLFMGQEAGTFTGKGEKISGEVILTEKPNRYTTDLTFTANIQASFAGQQQNQSIPVERVQTQGTWTEQNGQISLTDDNGTVIQILSSTSSEIVFAGNFTEQIEVNQFVSLDANSDVVFTITK